ncbi:MAG: hypothetical protein E7111_06050 [Bacteroidales bacterium]|nr:hypothetical protein [Bacteroidales bacterium]
MSEPIRDFFRKRKIEKYSKGLPTGLVPMSDISTVNVIMDVEDVEWNALKEDILAWGKATGIKVEIYFFDFRKLGKDEILLTSIQTTVARKDLNWYDMPTYEKIAPMIEQESDLLISLIDNGDFPIEFISKCSTARFKIGRKAYQGHCYDMIISGRQNDGVSTCARDVFAGIMEFLEKIKK